ncbi:MAG: peptide-methionine (S)-S-oxide reductase MsrA [Alphaproteobacteria bacterium]|nr:peptide-methionine (S)-S-oxide reductase MsrA [Alphaproteobacteria bacterium]
MKIVQISIIFLAIGFCSIIFVMQHQLRAETGGVLDNQGENLMSEKPDNYPTAIFGGGCFWCLESEFRGLNGVLFTSVGYMGGTLESPSYHDVTTGETGHAEVVEITFDPEKITYRNLVEFFLTKAHDPTQVNRQGVDVGTQYRSEIFYADEEQKKIAQEVMDDVTARKIWDKPLATKLGQANEFWMGEEYHQQYYEKYERENGQMHPRVWFKKKMKDVKK